MSAKTIFRDPKELKTLVQTAAKTGQSYRHLLSDGEKTLLEELQAKSAAERKLWQSYDLLDRLSDPEVFFNLTDVVTDWVSDEEPDVVVAIGRSGSIFGSIMAVEEGAQFIPICAPGILTGPTISINRNGKQLEMPLDAMPQGARAIIIDGTLKTGDTMLAATDLVKRAGGHISAIFVLLDYEAEGGHQRLNDAGHSVISYLSI